VRRLYPAVLAGLLLVLYGVLLVASIGDSLGTVALVALALYVLDALLERSGADRLLGGLRMIGADRPWRYFYRLVLVMVFLLRADEVSRSQLAVVVTAVIGHRVLIGLYQGLSLMINRRRLRRVETRNLDVPGAQLPPPLPAWLRRQDARLMLHTELIFIAGLLWAYLSDSYDVIPVAAVLMAVAALVFPLALLPQLVALNRLPSNEDRLLAAQEAVLAWHPEVILHFSGGVRAVYQVNMWLETMERLDRRVLVLLRERRYLDSLAETSVPVLCLPFTSDLMNLQLPDAGIALYVANVGKNIHLLRVPTLKSAFIGHGDSDKTASFNPYTKVYDEVWVAGEAGRDRYERAQVGVRTEDIVLVGRPQLDGIHEAEPRPAGAPFTVLYAPTWEGWTEDPNASSLVPLGRQIVQTLLDTPGVRVIYKPHPLTGTVSPAAARISTEIVAMLAAPPHLAVLGQELDLYQCFDSSDALISDISSVVSDYLRSEKPYFVTNGAGIPDELFREQNSSAAGAYLIGPDVDRLAEDLADARGADRMRARRREVRRYVLGDPEVPGMVLFAEAVEGLLAKARARAALVAASERQELPVGQQVAPPLADSAAAAFESDAAALETADDAAAFRPAEDTAAAG
jgi:hypothetical protein